MTCENCGDEMETESVSCGADPSHTYRCPTCGRSVKHGWGPPRVRYAGRKIEMPTADELLNGDAP